ncbi:protein FANTASTIC FOUR 1-like [Salvia splendens]|uniref:protein FANTASTIC FOUR 1-like n=1 Tax=Salvia splendens TaxID=180675 RepID=UPI001C256890|nr:protein FANTASTIC FOUR 1-like [Salvia splendens]
MAACGGIEQIFEKPLPESQNFLEALSPWKHIKGLKSNTELFGELHFKETHSSSSSVGDIKRGRGGYYPPSGRGKHNQSFSSDSLSLCTEGLGFESFDDVEETSKHGEFCCREVREHRDGERSVARDLEKQRGESARASRAAFPPPISCIGRSGKPWVWFKSYREDGRFILKEIRIPTQEFLHACREDGRLQLRFVQSDDEDEAVGEEDELEAEVVDDQDEL